MKSTSETILATNLENETFNSSAIKEDILKDVIKMIDEVRNNIRDNVKVNSIANFWNKYEDQILNILRAENAVIRNYWMMSTQQLIG